MGRKE
jgi:hypothetical protein